MKDHIRKTFSYVCPRVFSGKRMDRIRTKRNLIGCSQRTGTDPIFNAGSNSAADEKHMNACILAHWNRHAVCCIYIIQNRAQLGSGNLAALILFSFLQSREDVLRQRSNGLLQQRYDSVFDNISSNDLTPCGRATALKCTDIN